MLFCGESGIRTRGTLLEYTHFPGVLLKPLGHLSNDAIPTLLFQQRKIVAESTTFFQSHDKIFAFLLKYFFKLLKHSVKPSSHLGWKFEAPLGFGQRAGQRRGGT